ncbi:diphthamide synthesis protein [Candidatus Altiarchaeota archaeon]
MSEYDLETDKVVEQIRASGAQKIGLQFPEGLRKHATDIADSITSATGAQVFIFTDTVYGACDTKTYQAEKLGLDLLIHYGHTSMKPRLG